MGTKQEVCEVLQRPEVYNKLKELRKRTKYDEKEHGFTVCSNGSVSPIIDGSSLGILMDPAWKYCNYEVDIDLHSHPRGSTTEKEYPYPSKGDIVTYIEHPGKKQKGSCIYGQDSDAVTCFSISDQLINKYQKDLTELNKKLSDLNRQYFDTEDEKKRQEIESQMHSEGFKKAMLERMLYNEFIDSVRWKINNKHPLGKYSDNQWIDTCPIDWKE